MKDHLRIEELFAARALGGLDAADEEELTRSVTAHGSDCSECRRLEDEYREVAGRLAFALPPERVPGGMADRILEEAAARKVPRVPAFRRVAAALAAALLLGLGAVGGYMLAPDAVPGLTEAAAYISQSGVLISSFEGSGQGSLALAYKPGRTEAYVIGSGLSSAPQGKVYELWLMRGDDVRSAGTFVPNRDVVVARVRSDPSTSDRVAVTLERAPGTRRPTTPPIFAAPITTS